MAGGTFVSTVVAAVWAFIRADAGPTAPSIIVAVVGPFLTAALLHEFIAEAKPSWSAGLVGLGAAVGLVGGGLLLRFISPVGGDGRITLALLLAMTWAGAFAASCVPQRLISPSLCPVSDSLKVALGSLVACVVAASGCLEWLGESAATAAFLLYFTWPMLSLVAAVLTALLATRDMQRGRRQQAGISILLSLSVLVFSLTHFHGFDQ